MKEFFWNKVNKNTPGECWEWTGSTNGRGYGRARVNGKLEVAHRVSYQWKFGKISKDVYVCHKCDNTLCVNPDHLFLGTQEENMQDMIEKGRDVKTKAYVNRHKTHCIHGHKYTDRTTYVHHNKDGYIKRQCLVCKSIRELKIKESKK